MKPKVGLILLVLAAVFIPAALLWYWPFASAFLPGLGPKASYVAPAVRPAKWAEPLDQPPLENFHRVSRDLYRGAQPEVEGMRLLKTIGIKTVVNLRSTRSQRKRPRPADLGYNHIRVDVLRMNDDYVVQFLRIATDPARTPVFVHCRHGADRTGTMCAMYRIAVCGWSKDDAINEMTNGGFGYHREFRNLIKYIEQADIDRIRRRAGITTQPASTGAAE